MWPWVLWMTPPHATHKRTVITFTLQIHILIKSLVMFCNVYHSSTEHYKLDHWCVKGQIISPPPKKIWDPNSHFKNNDNKHPADVHTGMFPEEQKNTFQFQWFLSVLDTGIQKHVCAILSIIKIMHYFIWMRPLGCIQTLNRLCRTTEVAERLHAFPCACQTDSKWQNSIQVVISLGLWKK